MLRSLVVPVATSLLFAACSGSGGGGVSNPPTATITEQNALVVAGHVLDAVLGLAEIGDAVSGSLPPIGQAATPLRLEALLRDGTLPGPFGGSVEYLWEDADDDARISSGDTMEMVFDGYLDDSGVGLDGWHGLGALQVVGDPAVQTTWTLAGAAEIGNLGVVRNGGTIVLAGDVAFDLERRPTVAYTRLRVPTSVTAGDVAWLGSAVVDYAEYDAEGTFYVVATGSLAGEAVGGIVAVATIAPTGGFVGEPNPSRGAFLVRGVDGCRLEITIVDSATIRVDLDADGDGTFETTLQTDWQSL
jgi:hypothetical protein